MVEKNKRKKRMGGEWMRWEPEKLANIAKQEINNKMSIDTKFLVI